MGETLERGQEWHQSRLTERAYNHQALLSTACSQGREDKMTKLTQAQRNRLPSSAFAIPERRAYPIDTSGRARNALSRGSQFATPSERERICSAVGRKY